MKIGIVGAGAMGSVYGALFTAAGHDVWLVDVWREHVDAVRAHGLFVSGASGERRVRPNATLEPTEPGHCALVVLATKMWDLEAAARTASPMIDGHTAVLTIQNGLGNAEVLEKVLGHRGFLIGIAGGFGASIKAPGHVHHNGWEKINVAEALGGETERLRQVVQLWREAGFKADGYSEPGPMVWSKLICNIAYSAVCTVTSLRIGQVLHNHHAQSVSASCAGEAYRVALAKGIRLPFADAAQFVAEFGRTIPNAAPSMLLDMLAGRRTEVDALYRSVQREAERLKLTVPHIATMAALVEALELKNTTLGRPYGVG
jgi:2-dehydropantoate 2-reductase